MPPTEKKFVKYNFDDSTNRTRDQRRPSKENFKEKDNNPQNRSKRHVSYTEKSTSKQNVLRDMINSFIPIKKPSTKIEQLMKTFPRFFSSTPKEPEPYNPELLNSYLTLMGKKIIEREARTFVPFEPEPESDPDWDSDSDIDGGIESKKIDEEFIQKARQKLGSVKQLNQNQLKRHQKQFLEDYYRQKHQEELQIQKDHQTQQKKTSNQSFSLKQEQSSPKNEQSKKSPDQPENEWTDYQQKQVNEFLNMGFIQKIDEEENSFADDDFSVEDEKSEKSSNKSSSEDEDDIFGDEGPTTIVKKKQVSPENSPDKNASQGTVLINSHIFSRIAEAVGIPPGACIWIIRNKSQRYKVSTQFMDEMYRLNNFCESLPYVSLNHSEFVHNNDVQKQKGLQIFKKFNARKHQGSHHHGNHQKSANLNRNYDNKRKYQYKPSTPQGPKSHLNKK